MPTEGQSDTKTPEQLHLELSKAMRDGDSLAIDKLMNSELDGESEPEEVPEPEATPAEAAEPEEVPEPEASTEPAPSWEDSLSDEAKDKVRALKEERDLFDQRIRSELGRVPNLQRELAELKRKLQEPQRQPQAQVPATPAAPKQNKFAEKLAQVKEVDPVLADMLEETLVAVREEIAPLREELGNEIKEVQNVFKDREAQQNWQTEKAKLLEAIPQADDVFKLPLYQEWKAGLSPAMLALATSDKADDVVEAIEAFGRFVSKNHPELLPPAKSTTAAPAANPQVAKVQEQRQQRLQARNPAPAATPPRAGDGIPDDPEELHRYFVKKIRAGEL